METAIVILKSNSAGTNDVCDFRVHAKNYIGLSRYKKENESEDGYYNAIVLDGKLSEKEKKYLMEYSENLFIFFIEGNVFAHTDLNTIKDDEETA